MAATSDKMILKFFNRTTSPSPGAKRKNQHGEDEEKNAKKQYDAKRSVEKKGQALKWDSKWQQDRLDFQGGNNLTKLRVFAI